METEQERRALLGRLAAGEDLSFEAMAQAVDGMMRGLWSDNEIALLLTGLRAKGETVEEIAGAATALRRHMTPIRSTRTGLLDTCGPGGDGTGTFNISTAAALVAAAAGVPVAKHGNRAITSRTGSADALMTLGVNVEASVPCVERCLDQLGVCFCFAPLLHQAMKQVGPVRRQLGVPTIFNLLGPLANPAQAEFQLMGVGQEKLRPVLARVLARLGTKRGVVVRGDDGLGEVTLSGGTEVTLIEADGLRDLRWKPADFGLNEAPLDALRASGPEESAEIIRQVLAGALGPRRDVVVLNAAAAIWTTGRQTDLRQAAQMAAATIDGGAARRLLDQLVIETNRPS